MGNHDDFNDDAIVMRNYTYIFKLHPEGRIHPIGLYVHNRTRNQGRKKGQEG